MLEPVTRARALHRHRVVAVGLLLIALSALALAVFTLRSAASARPVALYIADSTSSSEEQIPIRALDPATLADRQDRPPIVARSRNWVLSADGSTLVEGPYGDPGVSISSHP